MNNLFKRLKWVYFRLLGNPISLYKQNGMIIGENCDIKTWSLYSEAYLIEIGNHVQITSGVNIYTHGGGWTLRDKYPNFDSFGSKQSL